MQNSVQFVASRLLIQDALRAYNLDGNNSESNWNVIVPDMQAALGGGGAGAAVGQTLLMQSMIFPRDASGPAGSSSLLNTTGADLLGQIRLPYAYPNGTAVYLGDQGLGYPPELYPNLTYTSIPDGGSALSAAVYQGDFLNPLTDSSTLLLGPISINATFALISMTLPMINNTSAHDVLGWLTVVLDARLITNVINSPEGLDSTGQMLLVGPVNRTNHFPSNVLYYDDPIQDKVENQPINFVLPLATNESARHPDHVRGALNPPFPMSQYPAVAKAVSRNQDSINNAGADIATTNEAGQKVSTGFAALLETPFCDWVVIVEQSRSEVWSPITHLRRVLLACVFGTIG